MIKIEHTEVVGWEHAIRGMRNPMNSWEKSDSCFDCSSCYCIDCVYTHEESCDHEALYIGPEDRKLMMNLRNAGTDHRKFMRMITVYVEITAPLYWWKEFDTYKVGTVANSCSTMHKIHEKEFTRDDFSFDKIDEDISFHIDNIVLDNGNIIDDSIYALNIARRKFIETKDKRYWDYMIQLLPTSYNQKRTVMLNYEVLANIYKSRKNHKLDEWREFCKWIEGLPYSELITGASLKDIPICNEIMDEAERRVEEAK